MPCGSHSLVLCSVYAGKKLPRKKCELDKKYRIMCKARRTHTIDNKYFLGETLYMRVSVLR